MGATHSPASGSSRGRRLAVVAGWLLLAAVLALAWVGYQRPGLLLDLASLPFC